MTAGNPKMSHDPGQPRALAEELRQNRRGEWCRSAVAWAIAKETNVPQEGTAERLNLKSAANASQPILQSHQVPAKELFKEVRA